MNTGHDWRHVAALASLPGISPQRLRRMLDSGAAPDTWQRMCAGEHVVAGVDPGLWSLWRAQSDGFVEHTATALVGHGVRVAWRGHPDYPAVLLPDPAAPPVLFMRGDPRAVAHRRTGIVGTRAATRNGRFFARRLGADLAMNGVAVVSGLARGIDIESHTGVLAVDGAPPIAVVASGLDVVYPQEHARSWGLIGERGLLLSESPLGTPAESRRFPMRNRIIAGLSEVLVVVESRARGGSMITVREAEKRGITVMAVPGPPATPPCEGTNALLVDGCAPVTCVEDVLAVLGIDHSRLHSAPDHRTPPVGDDALVLSTMGRAPRTIDEIALLLGRDVVETAVLLGRLEQAEWVAQSAGWWEALVG